MILQYRKLKTNKNKWFVEWRRLRKLLGCFVDAEVYSKRSRKRHLCHHDDKAETATN